MSVELNLGSRVRLSGLTSAESFNGKTGVIEAREGDRWVLVIDKDADDDDGGTAGPGPEPKKVKVLLANCTLVADEESRFREALAKHDRATIRSIMKARQVRQSGQAPDGTNRSAEGAQDGFNADMFSCPICHNLLYKPCVNSCGHAFCFWCLHSAMNAVGTSSCPMCRNPFTRFSAVFEPLHRFLLREFPDDMFVRENETVAFEREEMRGHQAPDIPAVREGMPCHLVGKVDAAELLCVSCRNVVTEPVVPVCAHLICRDCVGVTAGSTDDGVQSSTDVCPKCKIPIVDSVGRDAGALKVCSHLEPLLETVGDLDQSVLDKLKKEMNEHESGDDGSSEKDAQVRHESGDDGSTEKDAQVPPQREGTKDDFIHFGVGCDGCGKFPMVGHAYHCLECPESIGFDMCHSCCLVGRHLEGGGRFNQSHDASHKMEEREQVRFWLHDLSEAHPELTPEQILTLVQMHHQDDDAQEGVEDT